VSVAFGTVNIRDTHCTFFNLVHSCSNIRTRSIGHVLDDWHMLERDANKRASGERAQGAARGHNRMLR
jgi:hypothetical protein